MCGHFHGLRIDHGDVGLVFDIDIHMTFTVSDCLLGRAVKIDRAQHRAVDRIDNGRVWHAMTEHINTLIEGVEQNAVRAAFHVDRLDGGKSPRIPHHDWLAA